MISQYISARHALLCCIAMLALSFSPASAENFCVVNKTRDRLNVEHYACFNCTAQGGEIGRLVCKAKTSGVYIGTTCDSDGSNCRPSAGFGDPGGTTDAYYGFCHEPRNQNNCCEPTLLAEGTCNDKQQAVRTAWRPCEGVVVPRATWRLSRRNLYLEYRRVYGCIDGVVSSHEFAYCGSHQMGSHCSCGPTGVMYCPRQPPVEPLFVPVRSLRAWAPVIPFRPW